MSFVQNVLDLNFRQNFFMPKYFSLLETDSIYLLQSTRYNRAID